MDRIHSVDVQPAGNRVDHILVINGVPAARFDELKKALDARRLVVEQALEQRHGRRINPGVGEVVQG